MNNFFLILSALILLLFTFLNAQPSFVVLEKPFYWLRPQLKLDTLGFDKIEQHFCKVSTSAKSPGNNGCKLFAQNNQMFVRVKKPSAISLCILKDLNYEVLLLTQWNGSFSTLAQIDVPGVDQVRGQRLLTDLQWELIERYTIEKPDALVDDYTIHFYFTNGAQSIYKGRDNIYQSDAQLTGTTEGISFQTKTGTNLEALIKRYVFAIYIIVPIDKKTSKIISEIESSMDKIKLDLSYKVPELVEVPCPQ